MTVYEVCIDYLEWGGGKRYGYDTLEEANEAAKERWAELDDEYRRIIDIFVEEGECEDEDDYPNQWEVYIEDFDCWRDLTEEQIQSRLELGIIDDDQAEDIRKKNYKAFCDKPVPVS